MNAPTQDLATLVSRTLPMRGVAVLAVSGGLDSMALLDIAAAVRRRRNCSLIVATYDHGSGPHSAQAASLVVRRALAYGIPVVTGRADALMRSEAAWRAARWEFLRGVAGTANGIIVTAHTRDDQVETVLMRAMRGAGARGLAGLKAPSLVHRPFVDVTRRELESYARKRGLSWSEDPTNKSRGYLRNRVRRDVLPALARSNPRIVAELIAVAEDAASWRRELRELVDSAIRFEHNAGGGGLDVVVADLKGYSREALAILWPELVDRVGATLDRRGVERIVEFTMSGKVGRRIQLSGGWELSRSRDRFELRARAVESDKMETQTFQPPMTWGRWAFRSAKAEMRGSPWSAAFAVDESLRVRAWRAGDRLTIRLGARLVRRKVKYFLSDAGITGHIRATWPVILAGDEIVWIPGVRRSDAATARSGRPVVTYICDYLDRRS